MKRKQGILWLGILLLVLLGIATTYLHFTKASESAADGSWDGMDITALTEYQSAYIGDAANVSQLFYRLPLNDLPSLCKSIYRVTKKREVGVSDLFGL